MTEEEIRKIIFSYIKEKLTVEVQGYDDGNFAVRIFLDGYLMDSDYSHIHKA